MAYLEKEFKNLLTKEQYLQLKNDYQSILTKEIYQTNSYFDFEGKLEAAKMALRIRLIDNNPTGEVTLKIPQKSLEVLEVTEELPREQLEWWIETETFVLPTAIQEALLENDIRIDNVHVTATLRTHRLEGKIDEHSLLVLDKSRYYDNLDYELEMEVDNLVEGHETFQQLLRCYDIAPQPSPSKIRRAIQAKRNLDS